MITQREIQHLATALSGTAPLAKNYTSTTLREMSAATTQWRRDVERVAAMLELAQDRSIAKNKTFNKARFLMLCGVDIRSPEQVRKDPAEIARDAKR